ncbi:MAG: hypothetical protein JNK11_11220 [Alphaproteobacteria bacterium]|nr:hypothetical protein [Alphaproteobacteria bacterium]
MHISYARFPSPAAMVLAAVLLAVGPLCSGAAAQAPKAPPASEPAFELKGFRSARFGMTESEVREAARKDFAVAPGALKATEHPTEGTRTLVAEVDNLLPGAGRAAVIYLLGATSAKLMQINVVFGSPVDPQAETRQLAAAALALQRTLLGQRYVEVVPQRDLVKPDGTFLKMPDGSLVAFSGRDGKGRQTNLRLIPPPGAEKDGKLDPASRGGSLRLSYIADPERPDVRGGRRPPF